MPVNREIYGFTPGQPFRSLGRDALQYQLNQQPVPDGSEIPADTAKLIAESPISPFDKYYAETIMRQNPENPALKESIDALLNSASSPAAKRKIAQRKSVQVVDLEEALAPFSKPQRVHLASNLGEIQLTDGCSVGCSFCGISALRKVEKAFSLESVGKFGNEFGEYSKDASLYYASDPFDWSLGDYAYLDIVSMWGHQTGTGPFTSTAVPQGAEFAVLETLHAYSIVDKIRPTDAPSIASRFRLSKSNVNSKTVEHILRILKIIGAPDGFVDNIEIVDLTAPDYIRFNGHAINHPKREPVYDGIGIACTDGVIISPHNGVWANGIELCTKSSPKGMREQVVDPTNMQIPRYRHIGTYDEEAFTVDENGKVKLTGLMPYVQVLRINQDGHITGESTLLSIRRNALAFGIMRKNIDELRQQINEGAQFVSDPGNGEDIHQQLDVIGKQLKARFKTPKSKLIDADDDEAHFVAKSYKEECAELLEQTKSIL